MIHSTLLLLLALQGDPVSAVTTSTAAEAAASEGAPAAASTTPTAEPERSWTGRVDAGLTLVSGNNESTTGSLQVALGWEGELWTADATAGYTGVRTTDQATGDASTTTRLITATGGVKRFFSTEKNLYGYGKVGARKDVPNGLTKRNDAGAGVGYRFDFLTDGHLDAEAGVSYVSEELVGVADSEDTAVGRFSYDLGLPVSDGAELFGDGEYFKGGDVESFTSTTGVRWHIGEKWFLQAAVQVNWDGTPAPGFSSTDQIVTLSLGVDL